MRGRAKVRQNDFAFGELSPEHAASGDRDSVSRSLNKARNIRILNSFSFCQRFGSTSMRKLASERVLTTLIGKDGTEYIGALKPGAMEIYDTDGSFLETVSGSPWATLDEVKATVQQARVGSLYVAHNDYPTQVFTQASGGTWSVADYAFQDGSGNAPLQPYFRYAAKGITMQPSALTGSVTLTFSADVLDANHVGAIFRYGVTDGHGQEILITIVTDTKHATGTVLNTLPPTVKVTVGSSAGFLIGEEVKGLDTLATGFITNISGNDITILMTRGFQGFDDENVDTDHNGTVDSGEYLVGEFTRSYITKGSLSTVSPAASVAWDEAVISAVHGYPGSVFEREGRLGFTRFRDVPDLLCLSAPDAPEDFDVGSGTAGDAIQIQLGEENGQRIIHCVSAANLMILTTKAAYYVPEGTDVPLSFQTFSVVKIGPVGTSSPVPAVVDEGVIYIDKGGNRVIALLSTGSLTAPWKLAEVSRQASHLIVSPTGIAVTNGSTQAPERYVMVMNSDGTIAVLFFAEAPARLGWVLWNAGNGQHTSMTCINGFLYTNCNRTMVDLSTRYFLERFDADFQLDCSHTITLPGGQVAGLAGETVAVNQGTKYLGTFSVDGSGNVTGLIGPGDFEVGYDFGISAALWPPEPEGDDRMNFSRRHIGRVSVRVEDTNSFWFGLAGQGEPYLHTVPVYMNNEDTSADPPLRSDFFRAPFLGWQNEPNVRIGRPIPQPVKVLAVVQEVAF